MKRGTRFYLDFTRRMQKSYRKPSSILLRVHGEHCQRYLHAPQQVGVGVWCGTHFNPILSHAIQKQYWKLPLILLRVHGEHFQGHFLLLS